jgi:hypothetical protein
VLLWIVSFAVVDIDYALVHGSVPFAFNDCHGDAVDESQ